MKIDLLSNNNERCLSISGQITEKEKVWFKEFLNHAWLKKTDVSFDSQKKIVTIKLLRHEENTKAKKRFLGITIWEHCASPARNCILTIRDVEKCVIENNDPDTQKIDNVIIGGVLIKDNEVYIGASCRHENDYGIILNVSKINVTLKDV